LRAKESSGSPDAFTGQDAKGLACAFQAFALLVILLSQRSIERLVRQQSSGQGNRRSAAKPTLAP